MTTHDSYRWMLATLAALILATTSRAASDETIARWDFHDAGNAEGWRIGNEIGSMTVADGLLKLKTTGRDAFILAPEVNAPLDGCEVRVRLRANRLGNTQVYWLTNDSPAYGEHNQVSLGNTGSEATGDPNRQEGFQTLSFLIGKPEDAGRALTGFRVDPGNGAKVTDVEIDFIELLRPACRIQPHLYADGRCFVDVGDKVDLHVQFVQVGGRAEARTYHLVWPDGGADSHTVPPGETARAVRSIALEKAGIHQMTVALRDQPGTRHFSLSTSLLVGDGERLPTRPGIATDRYRLDLMPTGDAGAIGAARWMVRTPEGWRLAGWLMPLAEITVQTAGDQIVQRHPGLHVQSSSPDRIELAGSAPGLDAWSVKTVFQVQGQGERQTIRVDTQLNGPENGRLIDFSGPILRVTGEDRARITDRFGLFGGLEFLEPGWDSSSAKAVGEKFAQRWSPHPFKVTLPLMAIESGGVTSSLMWHPLQTWSHDEQLPQATFASPNFLDHQSHHLMKLSVPNAPRWRGENEAWAHDAFEMAGPVSLTCQLHAEPGLPVALTARRWYEIFGAPPPPPPPHGDREIYELIIQCFGDTIYWSRDGGWRHHWYLNHDTGYKADVAAMLLGHAAETGEKRWIQRTDLEGRSVIDAAGTLFGKYFGHDGPRGQIRSMRPDHTWPFHNSQHIRETAKRFTDGKHDSLGEDGSTSLGTCATPALAILSHAHVTGDPDFIDAGLKALDAMRQFRVPRGAQVWEVHQQIPDVRAAALAVKAYRIAYEITGDERWLDDASYWAWSGVSFAYGWRVPIERMEGSFVATRDRDDWDRLSMPLTEPYRSGQPQVTPYGTVPVLGPSFYVVNWFGVLVQWCGLEWAHEVMDLDRHRPDPMLRYIAEGVLNSGLQQMIDKGPWLGMYPDAWHLIPNIAHVALIYPSWQLQCLQVQGRLPRYQEPWTSVLRDDRRGLRWHVSGWGEPVRVDQPVSSGRWTCRASYLPGQPSELLIGNVDEPLAVRAGDGRLERRIEGDAPDMEGWCYDAKRRVLAVRFTHTGRECAVAVDW